MVRFAYVERLLAVKDCVQEEGESLKPVFYHAAWTYSAEVMCISLSNCSLTTASLSSVVAVKGVEGRDLV